MRSFCLCGLLGPYPLVFRCAAPRLVLKALKTSLAFMAGLHPIYLGLSDRSIGLIAELGRSVLFQGSE